MSAELTPTRFVQKWSRIDLTERAALQKHFLDLCRPLGQPTPAETDAIGEEYTFEKGVAVTDPEGGWSEDSAEVWTETGAGQPFPPNHPLAARRQEIDQQVLANLLRLNSIRAGLKRT
ncbi:MAG TPA: hypothetical protein PK920_05210 [Phycisphaerae bacterium]|jgi:hypothetical protein|nr:hypothetical protein [Phycisphaerae bacterium]HPC21865.1 hypothetical protein [Phycisphaerae bacterium]HRT41378.1 hypothetical protein [Phycisphaerae bacterium]